MSENLVPAEGSNLPVTAGPTGLVAPKKVDLVAIAAQMQAMQDNNFGGKGGAGSYDIKGKVKIEIQKNGTLVFTNPFTGETEGGKSLGVLIIDTKFQQQRWPAEHEEVGKGFLEGWTKEEVDAHKGPLCKSVQYTDPVNKDQVNETGWFYAPAMSAYHARKMLPDLTGSNGPNGKQGMTLCGDCPLSEQGRKGKDSLCKPAGMMEVVVFKVGERNLVQPVYGYIKLPITSIIHFSEYLEQLKKVHNISLAQQVCTQLQAESCKEGARTWGKIKFHVVGAVDANLIAMAEDAIAKTEALLKESEDAEEGETSNAGAATAKSPF